MRSLIALTRRFLSCDTREPIRWYAGAFDVASESHLQKPPIPIAKMLREQ